MRTENGMVLFGITMALGIAVPYTANATGIGASVGHDVWTYANESCMRSSWQSGGVRNSCSTTELWSVELPASAGTHSVRVSGTGCPTPTQYILYSLTESGAVYNQTGWVYFPAGLCTWGTITLSSVTVPTNGTMEGFSAASHLEASSRL
jgi:hypothetical protein